MNCKKCKKGESMYHNPLLQKSNLTFGAPDFAKIKDADYLPAIKMGIEEQRAEIKKIVDNKETPSWHTRTADNYWKESPTPSSVLRKLTRHRR